jgi:hypothetical protein
MNVNLSPSEWALVAKVADYYQSWPAALAHDWIMREATEQYSEIYLKAGGREKDLGTGGEAAPPQDPPPAPDRES